MISQTNSAGYKVSLPLESNISSLYKGSYLADSYAVVLPSNAVKDPEVMARFIFNQSGSWASMLMGLRDFIVGWFGLKTARKLRQANQVETASRVGIFKIYQRFANEIILGEDDKHLDFRISLLLRTNSVGQESVRELVVTTVVQCHNSYGRIYINLIKPFHVMIIRSNLRRASQKGWPLQD